MWAGFRRAARMRARVLWPRRNRTRGLLSIVLFPAWRPIVARSRAGTKRSPQICLSTTQVDPTSSFPNLCLHGSGLP